MEHKKTNNEASSTSFKKPFDKKKWRQEKYSNKIKAQRWDDKRKRRLQWQLKKELAVDAKRNISKGEKINYEPNRLSRLKEAQLQYEQLKEEERQKQEEVQRVKTEKWRKIKEYQTKKLEIFRKLNQKTRKGQPLMRARMELLQEKIAKMVKDKKM